MTGFIDPRHKLMGHLPKLGLLQEGGVPPPINVEIDLSNRCSLGCEWCHFAFTHTRGPLAGKRQKPAAAVAGGDLMEWDLAVRIIDSLAAMGASIAWTGGGEPTLHPRFDDVIRYAHSKGVQQGIYTHGGHINEERAALLKEALTFVYVSLDAADAEMYKRDKGVDRFDHAVDGIRRLAEAKGDATIGVGYLVTSGNYKDGTVAARMAKKLGADYIQFRPTIRFRMDTPNEVDEDTDWLWEAADMLHKVQLREGEKFVVFDRARFKEYRNWEGHGYKTCWWSGLQTVITPNGKVWTCVNKREHPAAELGDCSVESFEDIWARRPIAKVDGSCRVLCRGHIANQVLDEMMAMKDAPHAAFV